MKKTIIILFLFIFTMGYANGIIEEKELMNTGNFFLQTLTTEMNDENAFAYGVVYGHLKGVWHVLRGAIWDSPEEMTLGQVIDIVKNYLEAHPETRHMDITFLIVAALGEKLPKAENPEKGLEDLLFLASWGGKLK